MIYGVGWPKYKSGFVAHHFNPKTYEGKRFEAFGARNEHRRELYREVVMSRDWIYAAIGAQPWHLVAFNFTADFPRCALAVKPSEQATASPLGAC